MKSRLRETIRGEIKRERPKKIEREMESERKRMRDRKS